MLDFPSSPTTGQVFGTWKWDGTKWMPNTNLSSPFVTSFNTRTGAVTLAQSDITAVGAIRDAGRNFIHNPTFSVAQRGAGPFTTTSVYTADRWIAVISGGDAASFTISAIGDAGRAAIGDESCQTALANGFTGVAAGSNTIAQRIENVRRLSGKTITLSFWAQAATAGLRLSVNTFQVFGNGGSPSASTIGTATIFNLSTSWARYSTTINVPSAAGATFGTNAGTDYTELRFYYSAGATSGNPYTYSGNLGAQSGTINLWGIQLEIGSVATPLDYGGSYGDQLRACQRYFQSWTPPPVRGSAPPSQASASRMGMALPVPMRAAPTLVVVSPIPIYNGSTTTTLTSVSTNYSTAAHLEFDGVIAAAWGATAAQQPALCYVTGSGTMTLSADL